MLTGEDDIECPRMIQDMKKVQFLPIPEFSGMAFSRMDRILIFKNLVPHIFCCCFSLFDSPLLRI